jgi:transcriptional regulator of acetoin/glycerol metabolism
MMDPSAETASVHGDAPSARRAEKRAALWLLATKELHVAADAVCAPTVCALASPSIVVGRGEDAGVMLADSACSRAHFQLSKSGIEWTLQDLGSKHGTWINGKSVERQQLASGDVIRAGESLLMFVDDDASCAPFSWQGGQGPVVGGFWARRAFDIATRFAPTELPVLVLGETGTGKEVIADLVHRLSKRTGALHAVNCAAIPAELAEAELFGHRKGAFSGAIADREGHLEKADGGTLFLDEVADLPLAIQAKLLRVLETGELLPIGAARTQRINVRYMAATCKDLQAAVDAGHFRLDLYQRLCGVKVVVPALCERMEEMPLLVVNALARAAAQRDIEVRVRILHYEFALLRGYPGNMRELRRVCERAVIASDAVDGEFYLDFAPELGRRSSISPASVVAGVATQNSAPVDAAEPSLDDVAAALAAANGNVSHAAEALRVHRAQIYRVLREHGRSAADYRSNA